MARILSFSFSVLTLARMVTGMRTKLANQNKGLSGAECRNFCATNAQDWEKKCTWDKCGACAECHTDQPSPTPTPSEQPTPTPAPSEQPSPAPATLIEGKHTPSDVMTCPSQAVLTTESMTCAMYDAVAASVTTLLSNLPEQCDATSCPQADWAGCVLRVAGHDFMDFADGQGGSDACTDMHDADNAGLAECLYKGEFGVSLNHAYAEHCTTVSLADFLVIAAEAVMVETRQRVLAENSNASSIDFRSSFQYGRTTAVTCDFAEGRLPNPERSCTAVEETFVQRMGLSWRQSAALMGVHTLGRANVSNSGYSGFWSDAENSRRFNNNYYVSILAKGWMPEKAVNGNTAKNQWKRVDQGKGRQEVLGKEMMLDTDMCLAFTEDNDGSVELRAETSDCCAWVSPRFLQRAGYDNGEFCGSTDIPGKNDFRAQRGICCDGLTSLDLDCGLANAPKGPAFWDVQDFAINEWRWLMVFQEAWAIATSNGQGALHSLAECPQRW